MVCRVRVQHSHRVESVVESSRGAVTSTPYASPLTMMVSGHSCRRSATNLFSTSRGIDRCAPCADDAHYMRCVQVCRATAEQHHGGVVARTEALRIVVVIEQERLYGVLHVELHLLLGVCHAVVYVVRGIDECFGRIGEHPFYVAVALHHGGGPRRRYSPVMGVGQKRPA